MNPKHWDNFTKILIGKLDVRFQENAHLGRIFWGKFIFFAAFWENLNLKHPQNFTKKIDGKLDSELATQKSDVTFEFLRFSNPNCWQKFRKKSLGEFIRKLNIWNTEEKMLKIYFVKQKIWDVFWDFFWINWHQNHGVKKWKKRLSELYSKNQKNAHFGRISEILHVLALINKEKENINSRNWKIEEKSWFC